MPGVLPHLMAGIVLYFIGRIYFKDYFKNKIRKRVFLVVVCLSFSLLPDVFLGIYYSTHVFSFGTLVFYHNLISFVFFPIAFILLFLLIFWKSFSSRPVWIMGLFAVVVHVFMDLFIDEFGVFI